MSLLSNKAPACINVNVHHALHEMAVNSNRESVQRHSHLSIKFVLLGVYCFAECRCAQPWGSILSVGTLLKTRIPIHPDQCPTECPPSCVLLDVGDTRNVKKGYHVIFLLPSSLPIYLGGIGFLQVMMTSSTSFEVAIASFTGMHKHRASLIENNAAPIHIFSKD